MQKFAKVVHWLKRRNPRYIVLRLRALLQRYGVTGAKAQRRTFDCVRMLGRYGCSPTFPTPGGVVKKNGAFCRQLQDLGAELAVHSYDHIDFHSLSPEESRYQFEKAVGVYRANGLDTDGFRCPYLSYSERVLHALPSGMFRYSSNKALWWDVLPARGNGEKTAIFDSLSGFYSAAPAETTVSTPYFTEHLLEIPASIPDDLQLYDGLNLGEEGMAQVWLDLLLRVHARGEMFILLFHPESCYLCAKAFQTILNRASDLDPGVWVTRLRDISDWWWERSAFGVDVVEDGETLVVRFSCTDRATVLVRGVESDAEMRPWHGTYHVLDGRECRIAGGGRPFVGVAADVEDATRVFLRNQGYIVDDGAHAGACGVYLTRSVLDNIGGGEVGLVAYLDALSTPLVRFWRWPHGYRSVLSITGDLDALSLIDYVSRVLPERFR
jgi:peptidoglycan/xylan/chitin deacetylase (PgdA/CDA1 family)